MKDRPRYPRNQALAVAAQLQAILFPACERIAIAGSLRRGKPDVGDIELLFIPKLSKRPDGLFDERIVDVCFEVCEKLLRDGVLAKRPNVNGHFAWGEKNKLAIHLPSGIGVDFFATSMDRWFMSLVIRTGPKDFNLRLIESASRKGLRVHAYGVFEKMTTGEKIIPNSEQEVLELSGMPWIEPRNR